MCALGRTPGAILSSIVRRAIAALALPTLALGLAISAALTSPTVKAGAKVTASQADLLVQHVASQYAASSSGGGSAKPVGNYTPPKTGGRIDIVIKFALNQRGKPYRWGASGPRSFDCSGLIMKSFLQIGIRLPHQSGAQMRYGRAVSRSQLRPGDLVAPHAGHVMIYIGNGLAVHASNPRTGVKVSKVYAFWKARRIVG